MKKLKNTQKNLDGAQMLFDLHKMNLDDIKKLSIENHKIITVRIEEKVKIENLTALNEVLSEKNFLVSVIIESENYNLGGMVSGINVFQYICNVKKLKIYVSDYDARLEDLFFLKDIKSLNYLDISTNAKKNLKFDELKRFSKITYFSYLCEGLNKEQHSFVNDFMDLSYFSIYDLNLELFDTKESLIELRVHRKLTNAMLIYDKFPNLENLILEKCKSLDFKNSISNLPNIINISLRYMSDVYELPKFKNPEKIKKISLLGLNNLRSLNGIEEMQNLEEIEITNIKNINIESFLILKKLKSLKKIYILFENSKLNIEFEDFARKNKIHLI